MEPGSSSSGPNVCWSKPTEHGQPASSPGVGAVSAMIAAARTDHSWDGVGGGQMPTAFAAETGRGRRATTMQSSAGAGER
jgi:hypothetical protein